MINVSIGSLLAIGLSQWSLLMGPLILFLLTSTYLITTLRSMLAIRSKKVGREPPTVPYWIPFLGSLIPFVNDTAGFISQITKKYGDSIPVRVKIGPQQGYLVSAPEHFATLLKASRNLSPKPGIAITMKNMFGTPSSAIRIYKADNSGVGPNPLPGTSVKPQNRVYYHQHQAAHKYLSGKELQAMTERFMQFLSRDLSMDSRQYDKWVDVPDLYTFWQDRIFHAANEALFGPHLQNLNPNFTRDFWEYISVTPELLKGLPRWMTPKAYQARDKVIASIKRWHGYAREHSDYTKTGPDDIEWDEYWGSKYLKVRQQFGKAMEAMDDDALAAEDLALIVAANANAIVCAVWFLLHTILQPHLYGPIASSLSAALLPRSPPSDRIQYDLPKLTSSALLRSIYAEILRLRVAVLVNRTPEHSDFRLGEWLFRQKRMICLSTRTAATSETLWNTGRNGEHPLSEFWGERFLTWPDDPDSGPLKKHRPSASPHDPKPSAPSPPETPTEDAVFSLDGLAGAWIPYGGGQFMCPGRHFAQQEIIGSFAMFTAYYDVALRIDEGRKVEPDMKFFGLGALPPKGAIPCRIRRKTSLT